MATQFGRFRILFRKSFIENVYINILKNIIFCNSFYLIIFFKHLRCFFTNAYGVRICSACGGNSRRHFGRTMCLHTKDTSTGQPTAGRSKLPSAAGVFRKITTIIREVSVVWLCKPGVKGLILGLSGLSDETLNQGSTIFGALLLLKTNFG